MPRSYPKTIRYLCLAILTFTVLFQAYQYVTGVKPGDSLSGTFGKNGTGDLVLFLIFTMCLALGYWLAQREWKMFLYVLPLCVISSVFGEMKLFLPVLIGLGGLTLMITFISQKQILRIIPFLAFLSVFVAVFFYAYNTFIPRARTTPLDRFIQQPQQLFNYLNERRQVINSQGEYYTDINRIYALSYGWDSIRKDPFTLLFGFGLGSRSESETLGTSGVSLQRGDLGNTVGTSLLVMIQELGIIGCLVFSGVIIWIMIKLIQGIRRSIEPEITALYYGLLLYTICWPIWLFYNTAWTSRIHMLLYWVSIGYALLETIRISSRKLARA